MTRGDVGMSFGIVVMTAALAAAQPPAPAGGQRGAGGGAPAPTNLQILPKVDLEKAIELDPNTNQAKAQLQQLKGQ